MPITTRESSETSVTFSLVELARLEEERVREEDERRAKTREQAAIERREAEARRRADEERHIAAQEEARAKRHREEAEIAARQKAREQAALEVARIEAEGKARLEAENAARAHELSVLRIRTEGSHRKAKLGLAVVIGLIACAGPLAAWGVHRQVSALEEQNAQLRESQSALSREHDQARSAELSALDRRFAALAARPILASHPSAVEDVRTTAEAARKAIDGKSLDHSRLRSLGEALDALEAKIQGLERLAALDQRLADLELWADQRRKAEVLAPARTAAVRAKALPDDKLLGAYASELDKLRDALGREAGKAGGTAVVVTKPGNCTDPNDPLCGFHGQSL